MLASSWPRSTARERSPASAQPTASWNSKSLRTPGFEAPVNLAYSSRNRSAAVRIPPRVDRVVYRGAVASGAPYTRRALIGLTEEIVARVRPTAIVTHASFDRYEDHRAVASLVDAVRGDRPVYAFLVHAP